MKHITVLIFCFSLSAILFISPLFSGGAWSAERQKIPITEDTKAKVPAGDFIKVKLTMTGDAGDLITEAQKKAFFEKLEQAMLRELRDLRDIQMVGKDADVELLVSALMTFKYENNDECTFVAMSVVAHNLYASNRFDWTVTHCPDPKEAGAIKNSVGTIDFHIIKSFPMFNMKKSVEGLAVQLDTKCFKKVRDLRTEYEKKRVAEMRRLEVEKQKRLKKMEEEARVREIIEWKRSKYMEWKANKSMSMMDEELEKMGVTFEGLMREFREQEKREKENAEKEEQAGPGESQVKKRAIEEQIIRE